MMTFDDAKNIIKNRESKKLENNTYLIKIEGGFAVKLHNTNVVELYPKFTKLFTGSWYTPTTKDRINKYSSIDIIQHLSTWYISNVGYNFKLKKTLDLPLFYEGIKIDYSGQILSKVKNAVAVNDKNKKIKQAIKKYTLLITDKNVKTLIPDNSDCWYCLFKNTTDSQTWGDTAKNTDHLKNHISQKYIHGSIVVNALNEQGYQNPAFIIQMGLVDSVRRSITKYLQKRLLIRP